MRRIPAATTCAMIAAMMTTAACGDRSAVAEIESTAPVEAASAPTATTTRSEPVEPEVPEEPKIAIERWDQPDLKKIRYIKVTDQEGCVWWTPLVPGEDADAPYPVLAKSKPICRNQEQSPDGAVEWMTREEADEAIAEGNARVAPESLLASIKEKEDADEEEARADEEARAAKDAEDYRRRRDEEVRRKHAADAAAAARRRPVITTTGKMAFPMGGNMAMTTDGKMAIVTSGMAIPVN
jgi:hypothetical protein